MFWWKVCWSVNWCQPPVVMKLIGTQSLWGVASRTTYPENPERWGSNMLRCGRGYVRCCMNKGWSVYTYSNLCVYLRTFVDLKSTGIWMISTYKILSVCLSKWQACHFCCFLPHSWKMRGFRSWKMRVTWSWKFWNIRRGVARVGVKH